MTRLYPVWQFKSVRSHLLKLLHRYLVIHTDLRDRVALDTRTVEDLLAVCQVTTLHRTTSVAHLYLVFNACMFSSPLSTTIFLCRRV